MTPAVSLSMQSRRALSWNQSCPCGRIPGPGSVTCIGRIATLSLGHGLRMDFVSGALRENNPLHMQLLTASKRSMEACPSAFRFCHYACKCNCDVVLSVFFHYQCGQCWYEHMEFVARNVTVGSKWWKFASGWCMGATVSLTWCGSLPEPEGRARRVNSRTPRAM
jgi:hypothetical protein